MFVVGGPAGSGKTTRFPPQKFGTDFFSVDDRCAELNGGLFTGIRPGLRAQVGAECQRFIEQHIADRASFAVETTLRTDVAIRQAEAANAAGFSTFLFFVATGDVRLKSSASLRGGGWGATRAQRQISARSSQLRWQTCRAPWRCSRAWSASTTARSERLGGVCSPLIAGAWFIGRIRCRRGLRRSIHRMRQMRRMRRGDLQT